MSEVFTRMPVSIKNKFVATCPHCRLSLSIKYKVTQGNQSLKRAAQFATTVSQSTGIDALTHELDRRNSG
jgi:hypothetical protein